MTSTIENPNAVALGHAVSIATPGEKHETTIERAKAFYQFLTGSVAVVAAAEVAANKPTPTKPAAAKSAPAKTAPSTTVESDDTSSEAEQSAETADGPEAADFDPAQARLAMNAAILAAVQRVGKPAVVAALAKFGATGGPSVTDDNLVAMTEALAPANDAALKAGATA